MQANWIAIIPPLVTIICAISTKRIIPSLAVGLLAGSMLRTGGIFSGVIKATDYLANVLYSPENILIIQTALPYGGIVAAVSAGLYLLFQVIMV